VDKVHGWKTYGVAACMIIYASIGVAFDYHDGTRAVELIFAALAVMGIRHKMVKEK